MTESPAVAARRPAVPDGTVVGETGVGSGSPPEPVTRLSGPLAWIDRAWAWADGFVARWLPQESNPLAHAGAAANFALALAVVSGVALLVWYSPSLSGAYASVEAMRPHSTGGWVRALHRYSSDLAMLLVLVHALRVFFARKFAGPRWLPWLSGVALAGLIWFIGWTGYWLVWDQPAQQIAVTSMQLLDGLPIFGEPLGRLYVSDRTVPGLLFFVVFFTHMLLPLGIAIGLAVHLTRVSRARLFPNRNVMIAVSLGLAVASWIAPAPLDAPAAMAVKPAGFTVDAWYLTPLALALRLQGSGLWLAVGGTFVAAAAIPWLLGRRREVRNRRAVVDVSRCHACTQCAQDCPFDAITMVARTDGKRFPSQAEVNPAKCVGCGVCAGSCDSEGISVPWFDTRREEARIEAEVAAARGHGPAECVAFVPGDIDGPVAWRQLERWRERLRGFHVQTIPTASWVRPKLVERLLQSGVPGVLIVRDGRAEAAARDGNRWVGARLAGERKPVFRPDRAAGSTRWTVVDFDPSRPQELTRAAQAFSNGGDASPRPSSRPAALAAALVLGGAVGIATVWPSRLHVTNPADPYPEFVFSFKALGDRMTTSSEAAAVDLSKPVHMRGRTVEKPRRADVIVRLTIDGATSERRFRAKGISRDGPALDEWRVPLSTGEHAVVVELLTSSEVAPQRWSGTIVAAPRRLHVVSYEPGTGFRMEE